MKNFDIEMLRNQIHKVRSTAKRFNVAVVGSNKEILDQIDSAKIIGVTTMLVNNDLTDQNKIYIIPCNDGLEIEKLLKEEVGLKDYGK